MVNLLRKHQQTLMLLVTALVIISFVWFYNYNKDPRAHADRVGVIYGRGVSQVEFARGLRIFEIAYTLRLFELLQTLVGPARSNEEARENFVWNSMIVRHEAERLGIAVTDEEVEAEIRGLPVFQTNGSYDSNKYNLFVGGQELAARGMTPEQLEELMRDSLRLEKLKGLLGTTVAASPAEVREAYEQLNRKTEVSVIRLNLDDFQKAVQITEDDLKKAFEEQKDSLKSDEQRKVKYVAFVLPAAEKPLAEKERVDELQKLADKAEQFAVDMTEKDAQFEAVAQKLGAEVKESPSFALHEPPAELGRSEEVARVAFEKLTMEQPNSDATTADNGYYVLQLVAINPSRPLTFEEAKGKLETQLKNDRAQEAMNLKATEIRNKIDAESKAGKSLADAAAAAGAKVESIPAFSFAEPPKSETPDLRLIMGRTLELGEGELSQPIPTGTGVVLIHVDKRLPIDEAKFEADKAMLAQNVARRKREAVFELWLKKQHDLADIKTARG